MPLLLIIGGVLVLVGLALLVAWFGAFLTVLKAFLPLGVIGLGGLLAYFGWEERQDRKGALMDFSSPAEANRYQTDALAYKERIDQMGGSAAGAEARLEGAEEAEGAETPAVILEKAPEDQSGATVTVTDPE